MPTRCNRWFLLQILLLAKRVSGTIIPIIRSSRVLYRWLLPVVFGALVFKLSVWCGAEGYVSGLRDAAAARKQDMVPETCWASNKICNKNHLLHLVGILFPHKKTYVEMACRRTSGCVLTCVHPLNYEVQILLKNIAPTWKIITQILAYVDHSLLTMRVRWNVNTLWARCRQF